MRLTLLLIIMILLIIAACQRAPKSGINSWHDLAGVDKAFVKKESQELSRIVREAIQWDMKY